MRAMPWRGGGKLTLAAVNVDVSAEEARPHLQAKPGPHVMLSVTDTGHGIPREIIDRIFDPFFTTKGVGKGTGLGLSTVIGIVKNHGGFVTVYSEPGRGTVFRVYLPATAGAEASGATPSVGLLPVGRGELILVVDDEAAIREATRRILEKHNYRVLTTGNGEEAIRMFVEHRGAVRLVLTDMMMPGMGGLALIRSLRVLEPDIKVVASSGLDQDDKRAEFIALGVTEVLAKPYTPALLLKALDRALVGER